ncbi:MAG: glycoside hydrolase family 5 protein [Oscillospiraceae bacterium]
MKLKRTVCLFISVMMLLNVLVGCQAEPSASTAPPITSDSSESTSPITSDLSESSTTEPVQMSDIFKEAVELGIAWEELALDADSPIKGADLQKLMRNSLALLGKSDSVVYLDNFSDLYGNVYEIKRYQLAQLLYGVNNDVIDGHNYALNATAVYYEVGGVYKRFEIWDCPDFKMIDVMCGFDTTPCNYAICAFDRITGDKLMNLYDDWTFRPTEIVTVESAVETVLHFTRSFEKGPIYMDVTDEQASVCTIDPELYTAETTLPDATNQNLPDWRGCNISYNSMFAGALCSNPDDALTEGNLDYLKELGVNFVHIYLSWSYFQGPDHTFDSKVNLSRLEQLDTIISWCMERDIHIQLVFNDVPNLDFNYQESVEHWSELCNSVFTNEETKAAVTAFWRMLAKRYAGIPNNYLSFNLMNECDPIDDESYIWGLGDAVNAIWEESPGRVIVADVHTSNSVTGESMAALDCALSYHFYNLRDISVISPEKEAAAPGFYESITGSSCLANASLYGPTYWDTSLPETAKGALKFTGAVGGATLSVTINDICWFDTIMKISANGQTLYEGMEPYTYDEATDYIGVNGTVTVTIPEDADRIEISCSDGSGFTLSDISLTLSNGTKIPIMLVFDLWSGTKLAEITVNEDGSYTNTLTLEHIKQNRQSLADLVAVGEKYGVDVMVGECGFFESGDPMAIGISQDAIEKLFMEQIETFEKMGLAWCVEYIGRYALVTPTPYLEEIEYRDLENSPYYVNLEMDKFFKQILAE